MEMLMAILDIFPEQPALLCQGNLTPSAGTLLHSGFLGKGKPKEISGWQPLALSSSYFPYLLFPYLFSRFYFFWTVSFIPAEKKQNITVGYAQKKPPLWRKNPTEIETHLWALPN